MPITLEELVVRLEADITQYKKAMSDAASVTNSQVGRIEGMFKGLTGGVGNALSAIKTFQAGVVAAAGVGGIAALVNSALEAGDELSKLSQTTNLSTKVLQEMKFAASQTNVEAGLLTQSLTIFNRLIGDAANESEGAKEAFDRLGISVRDTGGHVRSNESILTDVAKAIQSVGTESEKASILQDLFGKSGVNMLPIFKDGAAGLEAYAKRANDLGIVLSDDMVRAADETKDKMAELSSVVVVNFQKAILSVAPEIKAVTILLTDMAISAANIISNVAQAPGAVISAVKDAAGLKSPEEKIAEINAAATLAKMPTPESAPEVIQQQGVNELLDAQREQALLSIEDARIREVDGLLSQNDQMRGINANAYAEEIAANNLKADSIVAKTHFSAEKQKEIDLKLAAHKKKTREQELQEISGVMGSISVLQHSKSKEMAAVGKAAAIVQATISTYAGAAKALEVIPFPFGFAAAAAVIAAGIANVAKISGVDVGFQSGVDIVPGIGRGDRVPAMLEPGERVVRTDTNRILEQFLRQWADSGGSSGTARVEFVLRDGLIDLIEARLIERKRISMSLEAA